jgi:hypothetical protein
MSNALAIATVTETLRYKINEMLPGSGIGGAQVTTLRPDAAGLPNPGVNIFLYQVTPNHAFQNADLPTRRSDGALVRRPQAALDLHYLLTFYGEDATLDQQRLLGATVLELHAEPVLTRDIVRQVQNYVPYLRDSTLADQIDLVRVRPANLSLDDMNKLWMTFPNVDYALSVAYVAGVVLIETDDEAWAPALPVLKWRVTAVPFSLATIDSVTPDPVDLAPLVPSVPTQITLTGSNLDPTHAATFTTPGVTQPLLGTVQPGLAPNQLIVTLPPGLHPGTSTVQLTQFAPVPPFASAPPRALAQSNAAPFVIRPTIVSTTVGAPPGQLTVVVYPPVGPRQEVALLLNQIMSSTPQAFTLAPNPRTTETTTFSFDLSGIPLGSLPPDLVGGRGGSIPGGTYLVRLGVDGAVSGLNVDSSGKFSGPTVMI